MSQVNLLPRELLARQRQRRLTTFIAAGGVAALLVVLGFWFLQSQKLGDVNEQIAAQNANNAAIQAQIQGLQEFQNLQQEAASKQALLDTAFDGEVSFSGLLMDMSRVIPSDAYLTSLALTVAEAAPAAGAPVVEGPSVALIGSITANGQAAGTDSLASWLTRLESVQGWVNPWLTTITETGPFTRLYTFASGADLSADALTDRGRGVGTGGG